jgi:hypothetical protein
MTTTEQERITRDDLERKFQALQDRATGEVADRKQMLIGAGIGVAILLLALSYFFGRRAGTRRSAVVEIRRL